MREPIRILVKKEELTLEGIKQFYINVEREVGLQNNSIHNKKKNTSANFHDVNIKRPFSLKHPAKTAGAKPHGFGSCGRVSMGTPGKEIKGTVLEMRFRGDLFLNVQCPLPQDPVLQMCFLLLFYLCPAIVY